MASSANQVFTTGVHPTQGWTSRTSARLIMRPMAPSQNVHALRHAPMPSRPPPVCGERGRWPYLVTVALSDPLVRRGSGAQGAEARGRHRRARRAPPVGRGGSPLAWAPGRGQARRGKCNGPQNSKANAAPPLPRRSNVAAVLRDGTVHWPPRAPPAGRRHGPCTCQQRLPRRRGATARTLGSAPQSWTPVGKACKFRACATSHWALSLVAMPPTGDGPGRMEHQASNREPLRMRRERRPPGRSAPPRLPRPQGTRSAAANPGVPGCSRF